MHGLLHFLWMQKKKTHLKNPSKIRPRFKMDINYASFRYGPILRYNKLGIQTKWKHYCILFYKPKLVLPSYSLHVHQCQVFNASEFDLAGAYLNKSVFTLMCLMCLSYTWFCELFCMQNFTKQGLTLKYWYLFGV